MFTVKTMLTDVEYDWPRTLLGGHTGFVHEKLQGYLNLKHSSGSMMWSRNDEATSSGRHSQGGRAARYHQIGAVKSNRRLINPNDQ